MMSSEDTLAVRKLITYIGETRECSTFPRMFAACGFHPRCIHQAALVLIKTNRVPLARALLATGYDFTYTNYYQDFGCKIGPLQLATQNRAYEMVHFLLTEAEVPLGDLDGFSKSPLDHALLRLDRTSIQILLDNGLRPPVPGNLNGIVQWYTVYPLSIDESYQLAECLVLLYSHYVPMTLARVEFYSHHSQYLLYHRWLRAKWNGPAFSMLTRLAKSIPALAHEACALWGQLVTHFQATLQPVELTEVVLSYVDPWNFWADFLRWEFKRYQNHAKHRPSRVRAAACCTVS